MRGSPSSCPHSPQFALALALALALASSCTSGDAPPPDRRVHGGAVLHAQSGFLFRVGGYEDDGRVSAAIYAASLGADARVGRWFLAGSLPAGRAHAAVVSFGSQLYVLGGEDEAGPTDTIFLLSIGAEGRLSRVDLFAGDRPAGDRLPEARSRMAWVLHDGRVFLIGGRLADGRPSRSIVHARLSGDDGLVGDWYPAQAELSEPREDATADLLYGASGEARLLVAGGRGADAASSRVERFSLGFFGLLTAADPIPDLPRGIANPVMASDGDAILVAGGCSYDLLELSDAYRYEGGVWKLLDGKPFPASGPGRARVAGILIGLRSSGARASDWELCSESGLVAAPEPPQVHPGSGLIRTDTRILVDLAPSDTLRYSTEGPDLGFADSAWPAEGQIVSGDTKEYFCSFAPTGLPSGTLSRSWQLRSTATIPILKTQSTLAEGLGSSLESGWNRVISPRRGRAVLRWSGCSISVFEYDLYTWALDTDGRPLRELTSPEAVTSSCELLLSPDSYYVYCVPTAGGLPSLTMELLGADS